MGHDAEAVLENVKENLARAYPGTGNTPCAPTGGTVDGSSEEGASDCGTIRAEIPDHDAVDKTHDLHDNSGPSATSYGDGICEHKAAGVPVEVAKV